MNRAWKTLGGAVIVLGLCAVDLRAEAEGSGKPATDAATAVQKGASAEDVFALPKNFKPNKLQAGLLAKLREEYEPQVRELAEKLDSTDAAEKKRADEMMQKLRVRIKRQMNNIINEQPQEQPVEKKTETAKPKREPARVAEKTPTTKPPHETKPAATKPPVTKKPTPETKTPKAKPVPPPKPPAKAPKTPSDPKADPKGAAAKKKPVSYD